VSETSTRRDALRLAGLGAGTLALPALLRPATAHGQSEDDDALGDFLESDDDRPGAIELEEATALAYEQAAKAKDLDAGLKRNFELFRQHEQAHATALRQALDSLGFDLPDEIVDPSDSELLQGIERLETPNEFLAFLVGLEQDQVSYYAEDAPELDSEDMRRTAAEILGCQAQHLVVLREAQGAAPEVAAAIRLGGGAEQSQP
jgi:rubrerythrin